MTMYKLFITIVFLLIQTPAPEIPVGLLESDISNPTQSPDNNAGGSAMVLLPYSIAATATAMLIASMLAVVHTVKRRKKDEEKIIPTIQESQDNDIEIQPLIPDEAFLSRLKEVVESNLQDSGFSISALSKEMAMSRTPFFKKVKDTTGFTPWQFIMATRMDKAAELLSDTSKSMGEICRLVGIKDPSNFSKLFKAEFGSTPSEFRKEARTKKEERP